MKAFVNAPAVAVRSKSPLPNACCNVSCSATVNTLWGVGDVTLPAGVVAALDL